MQNRNRIPLANRRRAKRSTNATRSRLGTAGFERLEDRAMLAATPFGAFPDDTGEFMLGDVLVSVVLMESSANLNSYNANTEDWTAETIQAVKDKVVEGVTWWEDTLVSQFPQTVHSLNFEFDFTYADNPVSTDYEPISQISNYFQYWMNDFLGSAGFPPSSDFSDDIRAFNHAQRLAHDTDWAFTIFVVNDEHDADGFFAPGGSFSRAFSFAGGQFMVSPAGRPASTFAHETGHMFWARDEYSGGGSYTDHRGYYDTYNLNAYNNPAPGFTQADSIMTTGVPLNSAYAAYTSSVSSLEMIGWRDSDGDGIFDVADVPLTLSGSGYFDPAAGVYRFVGSSSAQPLFNMNPSGLRNDITMNRIRGVEYRVDGGGWLAGGQFDDYEVDLNLALPVPGVGLRAIEIRTFDSMTGVTSNIFQGDTSRLASVLRPGVNGIVWEDADENGQYDPGELGLAGWTVRLVDVSGQPLDLVQTFDPDEYPAHATLTNVDPEVTLTLPGEYAGGFVVASTSGVNRVFGSSFGTSWTPTGPRLRMDFTTPVTAVRLDAIGASYGTYARLEIYDADDNLLGRYTTGELNSNDVETMSLQYATPEIAYAIASGHAGTGVRLDRLRFGPETTSVTDALGTYSIPSLAAGTYYVEAISPAGLPAASGWQTVLLGEGEAQGQVDFAFVETQVSWQNESNPIDVSGDGYVLPVDVLLLINYINSNQSGFALPAIPAAPPPYFDVNGDNYVTASDVLLVITALNAAAGANGEASDTGGLPPSGGGAWPEAEGGEGEYFAPPALASAQAAHHGFRGPDLRTISGQQRPSAPLDHVEPWRRLRPGAARQTDRLLARAHRELAESEFALGLLPTHLDDLLGCIAEHVSQGPQALRGSRTG